MATPFDPAQAPDTSAPAAPEFNVEGLRRLGGKLSSRFTQYEQDRRLAELKWARNSRQFLGIYDPDIERDMDKNRSKAYPKITRVKCVSMLSRLMNLLFQADDKNWTVAPSAVPNLSQEDLQQVLDSLAPQQPPTAEGGMPPGPPPAVPSEAIEQAIREFASKRASRLELEIEDQLQEIGGSRTQSYVSLCRKVLNSGIQYGAGIVKGPYVEEQQHRAWEQDASGRMVAKTVTVYRPRFEFVPIWEYYPDMSAKSLDQMEGQFQRPVMSRHQLSKLRDRPDFIADQITAAMTQHPQGNYVRRPYETEMRAQGVQVNVAESGRNKYEAWIWEGFLSGKELAECGLPVPEDDLTADIKAEVWGVGNFVIKAQLDPWRELDVLGEMKQYHHFVFEDDETFLLGNGLPNIVRDSQMGVCAATRMALDNGSIQRVFEMKTALLSANQDLTAILPDKIFYRDDDSPGTLNTPAITPIEFPMALDKYQGLVRMFQDFADQETFVGAATGGDMQRGPSEPFRTAAGASMLRGDAALPFKDVVRNFDMFTESVLGALINFNRNFNPNPDTKGDFQPVARGATSLIAKEVQGIQLDNLAQTLTEEEKQYVNMRKLIKARLRVRDLDASDIVYDDAHCDQVDADRAAAQQAAKAQQDEMLRAQIREILSQVMKNLSQAEKNAANAEATQANVLLSALEKGLQAPQEQAQEPKQGE